MTQLNASTLVKPVVRWAEENTFSTFLCWDNQNDQTWVLHCLQLSLQVCTSGTTHQSCVKGFSVLPVLKCSSSENGFSWSTCLALAGVHIVFLGIRGTGREQEIVLTLLFGLLSYSGKGGGLVPKSRPTSCDPMGCSPPGSSARGISQARMLEWAAISFSSRSFWPRDWTHIFCIAGRFFTLGFFTLDLHQRFPTLGISVLENTDISYITKQTVDLLLMSVLRPVLTILSYLLYSNTLASGPCRPVGGLPFPGWANS